MGFRLREDYLYNLFVAFLSMRESVTIAKSPVSIGIDRFARRESTTTRGANVRQQ
jgi:hypothetical protein